jgi:proteic killer suppression protein
MDQVITLVELTKRANKSLQKAPRQVVINFEVWRSQIEKSGLEAVQRVPGYHDEPLKGRLAGIRSARMSDGYRVYYRIIKGTAQVVRVEEVNKHEYKKIERLFGY